MSIQKADVESTLSEVEQLVEKLAQAENKLEQGYARLGYLLLEVAEMQYWRVYYESWKEYLESLAQKYNRTTGRLQQYFLTVRDLSEDFSSEQLESIGITKAIELRKAKDYAVVLPFNVKKFALDSTTTVRDLRKLLYETFHIAKPEEGMWVDLEFEFMATEEQKQVLKDAERAARHTDPVISDKIDPRQQKLEVALRWAMEYIASHPEIE